MMRRLECDRSRLEFVSGDWVGDGDNAMIYDRLRDHLDLRGW